MPKNTESKKSTYVWPVIGGIVLCGGIIVSVILRTKGLLSESGMFSGITISIVLGLILPKYPLLTELNLLGNSAKFEKQLDRAEDVLKMTFRLLLLQAQKAPGGMRSLNVPRDSRVPFFFTLLEYIEQSELASTLKNEIVETAKLLALGQIGYVSENLRMSTIKDLSMDVLKSKATELGKIPVASVDTLETLYKTIEKYGGDSSLQYLKSGDE